MPQFKVLATFTQRGTAEKIIEADDLEAAKEAADELSSEDFPDFDNNDGSLDIDEVEACDAPEPAAPTSLQGLIDAINEFDQECEEAQHTPTDVAWNLLNDIRDALKSIKPPRVVITLEGGMVSCVCADAPVNAAVIDYDSRDDHVMMVPQDTDRPDEPAAAHIEIVEQAPERVAELWPLIEAHQARGD
jgi:hypothetical protein